MMDDIFAGFRESRTYVRPTLIFNARQIAADAALCGMTPEQYCKAYNVIESPPLPARVAKLAECPPQP
jgi:hypothetical protein